MADFIKQLPSMLWEGFLVASTVALWGGIIKFVVIPWGV